MAKANGLAAAFWLDGVDCSGDVGSLARINHARGILEDGVTGIDKSARERVHSHRNGGFEWNAWWNPASGSAFQAAKNIPTTDRIATYATKQLLGASAMSCVGKHVSNSLPRGVDGSFSMTTVVESTGYGTQWGRTLTAGKRTDTSATNGTAVDHGAQTLFGAQIFVHLFSFTGTSVTIKVQDSADNNTFADLPLATSGALSAIGAVYAQTSRTETVDRYARVVTTGTFSSAVFAITFVRNEVSTPL